MTPDFVIYLMLGVINTAGLLILAVLAVQGIRYGRITRTIEWSELLSIIAVTFGLLLAVWL